MANLELHNPEDTCSFVNSTEYNMFLGPVIGAMYEPLSEQEFQQLRAGASCAVSLVAAELPDVEAVGAGADTMSAPKARSPEPPPQVAAQAQVAGPQLPPSVYPYPGWVVPLVPRVEVRGLKAIAGVAGIFCILILGWMAQKGR